MLIMERQLVCHINGQDVPVPVRFFKPLADAGGAWRCQYEIGWPNGVYSHQAYGVDSVQALLLAMKMLAAELYTSDMHRSGCLRWQEEGMGYGLPLSLGLRDMYVGHDKLL
jgi:hypothetical protein